MLVKGKYSITFLVSQVVGCGLTVAGLVMMLMHMNDKFSLTNLSPIFKMVTGLVFALAGLVLIAISYRIRWMHKVIARLDAIEAYRPVRQESKAEEA